MQLVSCLPRPSVVNQLIMHSAFVKAAIRDVKAYLKAINSSALVAYAAVDGDADFRNTLADYIACGDDSVAVDLYGEIMCLT